MSDIKFNTIEEAIADFKAGKMVIAVDDDDLENEGSLLVAANLPHQKLSTLWQPMPKV